MVCGTSVILLVAVVFLARIVMPMQPIPQAPAAQAFGTDITVLSTGKGFDRAVRGSRRFVAAVFIGDELVQHDRMRDALSVVTLSHDRKIRKVDSFALAYSPSDMEAFVSYCRNQTLNTILVMAVSRSIKLPEDVRMKEPIGRVRDTFRALGTRAKPYDDDAASWAFICIRRPQGWVPLAEYYSDHIGVTLSFTVEADSTGYDQQTGRYLENRLRDERRNVHLLDHLESAVTLSRYALYTPAEALVKNQADSIYLPADSGEGAQRRRIDRRVGWFDLELGAQPLFRCSLDIDKSPAEREISFGLYVDGERLATQTIRGHTTSGRLWHPWEVDLAAFSEQHVDLELRVEPSPQGPLPGVYLGAPVLSYGPVSGAVAQRLSADKAQRRVLFLGRAYPLIEGDRSRVDSFVSSIREQHPDRLVWGGNSITAAEPKAVARLSAVMQQLGDLPQTWVPGRRDYALSGMLALQPMFRVLGNRSELLGSVRLLYVDTIASEGRSISSERRSQPGPRWKGDLVKRIRSIRRGRSVIMFMYHAPWRDQGAGRAADTWWMSKIHPVLAEITSKTGKTFYIVAADQGAQSFADGRLIDGVHYIVSGQPAAGDTISTGFLAFRWSGTKPAVKVGVSIWRPGKGFEHHEPNAYPWHY